MLRAKLIGLLILCYLFPTLSMAQIDTRNVLKVGTNALQYQEYVWAIQCFNDVIAAKPYLWEPYYFRAVAKHYLDDHRGATADCDSAILRNPYIIDLYRLRGLSQIHQRHFKEAIANYDHAITMATTPNQQDWFNRSLCYLELKNDTSALRGFDTITTLWPTDDKAYTAKAQIALQRKDTLRCYQLLDTTLTHNPRQLNALATYANLLASQGKDAQALPYYNKAIAQATKDSRLYFNRALIHYRMKRLGQALADYDTVITLSPTNYAAHYNRALLRMQVGADNEAIEDLNVIIKRTPRHALARFNRALLQEQVGQYQAAENDLTYVLQQYPNFLYGYEVRARIRTRLGKHKAAANDKTVIARDQLARIYKGKPRGHLQKVRRWEDENIEDFANLSTDTEDTIPTYAVAYRGLVQHQSAPLRPQPLFALNFQRNALQSASDLHYCPAIELFNQHNSPTERLYLSSVKPATDSATYAQYKQKLEQLRQDTTPSGPLLRSITQATLRRYDEALKSTSALPSDTLQALMHWQKATLLQWHTEADSIHDAKTLHTLKKALDTHYDTAVKYAPELRPYALYNKAVWHTYTQNYQEALTAYDTLIPLLPLPQAYFNRGLLLHQMGKSAQAISDLSRAGELGLYEAYSIIKQISNEQTTTP